MERESDDDEGVTGKKRRCEGDEDNDYDSEQVTEERELMRKRSKRIGRKKCTRGQDIRLTAFGSEEREADFS